MDGFWTYHEQHEGAEEGLKAWEGYDGICILSNPLATEWKMSQGHEFLRDFSAPLNKYKGPN